MFMAMGRDRDGASRDRDGSRTGKLVPCNNITQVYNLNGISISSAISEGLTTVTDRQTTDRPCHSICYNRPHLRSIVMQPKISMLTMNLSIPIAKGCLNLCRSGRCKSIDKETMQCIALPHKLTKRKYGNTEAWITAKYGIQIQQ